MVARGRETRWREGAALASVAPMQIELGQLERRYEALRLVEPGQRAKLLASLSAHAQQAPVTVVAAEAADRYVLIDGYARVSALSELGRDVVEAVVLEVSEAEALIRSHRLEGQRPQSALEQGWLIEELMQRHALGLEELAKRLGRSRSWVCRRLALVTVLPSRVQEAVREGQLSAQVATKYLVPLARANAAECAKLVTNLEGSRPSVREMHRLYLAWRLGDAERRRRIVENPKLFLKATEEEPAADETKLLLRDLRMLGAVSQRSERRLDEGAWTKAASAEQARLLRAWAHARRSFASLETAAEPWERADARPGHARSDLASSP